MMKCCDVYVSTFRPPSAVSRQDRSQKYGGRVSSNTEGIPEKMDIGVGGLNNAQVQPAALILRGICVEAKRNTDDHNSIVFRRAWYQTNGLG